MNSRDYKTAVDAVARTFADEDFKLGRHNFNDWALLIPSVFITKNAKADWTSSPGSSCGQNIKSECVIHWTYTSFFMICALVSSAESHQEIQLSVAIRLGLLTNITRLCRSRAVFYLCQHFQVRSATSVKRVFGFSWPLLTKKNCPGAIAFISLW